MAVASDSLAANTKGLVQRGNKVSRKRLALWFRKEEGLWIHHRSGRPAASLEPSTPPVSCEG